jgi:RNA polymerase sigma-70 factor (ECF subfamily)
VECTIGGTRGVKDSVMVGPSHSSAPSADDVEAGELERALTGDVDAFASILRRHDRRLRSLASKLLGGDVHRMDDTLQEAYARAFRALPRFRRGASIGTWLYRITYNACIDELRRHARRPVPVDRATLVEQHAGASTPDVAVVTADEVLRALATLRPEHRAAVVLVDGEGFDHETVARAFGVPMGTIGSWLFRGRAAIRAAIKEDH